MAIFGKQRLGIDLGTANTIIYIDHKGIALREPSVVAIKKESKEIVAYGREAEELVGRTSDAYEIVRPIQSGVIHDFSITKQMLAHYIKQAVHRSISRPEVVICVPSNITKVERKAVIDALRDLGISRAMIVDEAFAAALGADLPINEPKGNMIADIGGGTTDIATISFGEMVDNVTLSAGGHGMNQAIQAHVRDHYQLVISDQTAEALKQKIGNALYTRHDEKDSMKVQGRSVATAVPTEVVIHARIVARALDEVIQTIINGIKQILEDTPPEMSSDIMDSGIVLTGGGALLKRLPERLHKEIGIPIHLANKPLDCVAIGAGKMLKEMDFKSKQAEQRAR